MELFENKQGDRAYAATKAEKNQLRGRGFRPVQKKPVRPTGGGQQAPKPVETKPENK